MKVECVIDIKITPLEARILRSALSRYLSSEQIQSDFEKHMTISNMAEDMRKQLGVLIGTEPKI